MAAATTTQHDEDRRLLAGWDRNEAIEEWMNATVAVQRSYLEWLQFTARVIFPQVAQRN